VPALSHRSTRVLSGKARIEAANNAYDLCAGDFLVLPGGEPHQVRSAAPASAPPVPLLSLLAEAGAEPWKPGVRYRRTVHLRHGGGGAQSVLLIGIFYFGDRRKNPLLTALPPVLVVRAGKDRNASWLKMTLNAISVELAEEQPGSHLVIAKLADLLFMQSLRAFLATDHHNSVGWMRGIMDPLVGRAISHTRHRNAAGRCKRLPKKSAVREPSSPSDSALWSARERLAI
jgi:Cupin